MLGEAGGSFRRSGQRAANEHASDLLAVVAGGVQVALWPKRFGDATTDVLERLRMSGFTPNSVRIASVATTGVGPTPVRARVPPVQTPSVSTVTVAATPTRAKSPWRRLISRNALPVRGGIAGSLTSTSSSSGSAAVVR